jgi:N-acetylmuramoyl-L-alanine amidase
MFLEGFELVTAAKTVYGEARGEGFEGMVAVAWVIRNRVEQPSWWGQRVSEVCLKPWQFSCWNENDPNSQKLAKLDPGVEHFDKCMLAVAWVFGGLCKDVTQGATHYINPKHANPPWKDKFKETVKIGNHTFYIGN